MPLQFDQRLDRLKTRLREVAFWRARETLDIDGWRFDGEPIALRRAVAAQRGRRAVRGERRDPRGLAARRGASGARRRRREPVDR